jgi:hypothetical protein
MTEHGHPGWYSWLVVIGGCLASVVLSATISKQMNDRELERDRTQRVQRQEDGRRVACDVIVQMRNAYQQQEKLSAAGRDVANAWAAMAVRYRCN